MRTDRWLMLYRPTCPGPRAQSIQTVHTAHALARAGVEVHLAVEPSSPVSPRELLAWYGLEPHPGLRLRVLPGQRTLASAAWRAWCGAFLAQGGGVIYARSKRYARELVPWLGRRSGLVLEAHEVDSALARERGGDPRPSFELERAVLRKARGVVCNCGGTAELLRATHPGTPPLTVVHNASHLGLLPPGGAGVGVVGSIREAKDARTVAAAARDSGGRWRWIGGADGSELSKELARVSCGALSLEPPVAHRQVGEALASLGVLVVPLSEGIFGRSLTSPLKLWDARASGRPVVAADLPTVREIMGSSFFPYTPGDARSLLAAARAAEAGPARTGEPRGWDARAAELLRFVRELS